MGAEPMSADGSITMFWGDEEYKFRYAIGQFRELQEKVNERRTRIGAPLIGPMALLSTLRANDAWPDDVRDVLRIGLVGAGMQPKDAQAKLIRYFDNRPLLENMLPAFTVLFAGLVGDPAEKIAEDDAKKKTAETPTSQSSSVKSTEPALH